MLIVTESIRKMHKNNFKNAGKNSGSYKKKRRMEELLRENITGGQNLWENGREFYTSRICPSAAKK